jgi:hypothetical protein
MATIEPLAIEDIDRMLAAAVAAAPHGLTVAAARGALPKPLRPPAAVVSTRLRVLAEHGDLHRWPGRAERYAARPLDAVVRDELVAQLDRRGPQSATQIARHVLAAGRPRVLPALRGLVAEGRAHEHPPKGSARTSLFAAHPPDPYDYLSPDLDRLVAKLARKGFAMNAVRDAVWRWARPADDSITRSAPEDPADVIATAMIALNPHAREGALVYVPDLRQAVARQLGDKTSFDQALLALRAQGRIQLQAHPVPSELRSGEREAMVPDGVGGYYVAAGLRRG